jgi:DNA-binding MarR family transcriptional regulator
MQQTGAGPLDDPADGVAPALASRLGYLVKHAHARLSELTADALAPLRITGRELAVLVAIDDRVPLSQQEAARRLGVDRTTMVALIDDLEGKGLVRRQQDPADRRRNAVALTGSGRDTLDGATAAAQRAEQEFLRPLPDAQATAFRQALRALAFPADFPR